MTMILGRNRWGPCNMLLGRVGRLSRHRRWQVGLDRLSIACSGFESLRSAWLLLGIVYRIFTGALVCVCKTWFAKHDLVTNPGTLETLLLRHDTLTEVRLWVA